jgi:septal ring factor EnvC (AmiA/AmiB activator)
MPEKYITTPSTKRITGNIYASYIPSRPSVMPSPDFSTAELTKQVATLRAELRDGRLLQAKQRSQLSHESARIVALTRKYKEAKHERQELKVKLNSERGTVAAVEKRLSVAVKNHAEAQDKCARTMVECEKLRMLNEELVLSNEGLGVSKNEVKAGFDNKIKEIQRTFKIKLEEAEAAFVDRLEQNEQKLLMERLEETEVSSANIFSAHIGLTSF